MEASDDRFYLVSFKTPCRGPPGQYVTHWAFLFGPRNETPNSTLRRYHAERHTKLGNLTSEWIGACDSWTPGEKGNALVGPLEYRMILDNGEDQETIMRLEDVIRYYTSNSRNLDARTSFDWAAGCIQIVLERSFRLGTRWDPFADWEGISRVFEQRRNSPFLHDATQEPIAVQIFEALFKGDQGPWLFIDLYHNIRVPDKPYWALSCGPLQAQIGIPKTMIQRYAAWRFSDPNDVLAEFSAWKPVRQELKHPTQHIHEAPILTRVGVARINDMDAFEKALSFAFSSNKPSLLQSSGWFVQAAVDQLQTSETACSWAPGLQYAKWERFEKMALNWLQWNIRVGRILELSLWPHDIPAIDASKIPGLSLI